MDFVTWFAWRAAQSGPRIEPILIWDTAVIVTDSWCLGRASRQPSARSGTYIEIWSGTTSGPYALLGEYEKLLETAADIFEEFGVAVPRSGENSVPAKTSAQHELLLE